MSEQDRRFVEETVHRAKEALPDSGYEEAFLAFFTALFEDGQANPLLEHFLPFQRRIAWYGALNPLSQTLFKMTCPGLPDFYQGSELLDLNLVDPDNRRPGRPVPPCILNFFTKII